MPIVCGLGLVWFILFMIGAMEDDIGTAMALIITGVGIIWYPIKGLLVILGKS